MLHHSFLSLCRRWIVLLTLLLPSLSHADVALRPDHPMRYQVVQGDTLWSISSRFLKNPWQWQQLWRGNSQITYPHDIYVGDILELHSQKSRPWMSVTHVTRLSPQIRIASKTTPIPTIPFTLIEPFLNQARAFDTDAFKTAPYVVGLNDAHLMGSTGSDVYVRGIDVNNSKNSIYMIYRPGKLYRDPTTKKILGYEGIYIAKGALTKPGDPATLSLLHIDRELLVGDRAFAGNDQINTRNFVLHAPTKPVNGEIIDVLGDGLTQLGQYQSVVIDRGKNEGITPGTVLSIFQNGDKVLDSIKNPDKPQLVSLPDQLAGQLFIYRTYPHVSFGLIMLATRNMHVLDKVSSPVG